MGTVQSAVQARIDAQQTLDTIGYGIKSIQVCRSPYGASEAHAAQIVAAIAVASEVLGQHVGRDNSTLFFLKRAKRVAQEQAAAAKAAVSEIGTARQIRLALVA